MTWLKKKEWEKDKREISDLCELLVSFRVLVFYILRSSIYFIQLLFNSFNFIFDCIEKKKLFICKLDEALTKCDFIIYKWTKAQKYTPNQANWIYLHRLFFFGLKSKVLSIARITHLFFFSFVWQRLLLLLLFLLLHYLVNLSMNSLSVFSLLRLYMSVCCVCVCVCTFNLWIYMFYVILSQ